MKRGAAFAGALERLNIQQVDAAIRLGVSQATISSWVRSGPPRMKLDFIARRLGISVAELSGESMEREGYSPAAEGPFEPGEIELMRALRMRWRRLNQASKPSAELAIRTLWPDQADQVIAWLNQ